MRSSISVLYIFIILVILMLLPASALSLTGNGSPLKYISSCEMDFNGDNQPDIAFLFETIFGRELIVLERTDKGYNTFVVSKGRPDMYLSCHFGKTVKESKGLDGGKTYKTPGTYLRLHQPEGASVIYFWDGSGFKEVWTAD